MSGVYDKFLLLASRMLTKWGSDVTLIQPRDTHAMLPWELNTLDDQEIPLVVKGVIFDPGQPSRLGFSVGDYGESPFDMAGGGMAPNSMRWRGSFILEHKDGYDYSKFQYLLYNGVKHQIQEMQTLTPGGVEIIHIARIQNDLHFS